MTGQRDDVDLARAVAQLRHADPRLARVIDAHPDFDPRAWLAGLPPLTTFGALVFQVVGQQLSVSATRRILDRLAEQFGGLLPTPLALLAAPEEQLRRSGLSGRKAATLRILAGRFVDGSLQEATLRTMADDEIERVLTAIPGVGPWTVHGFLIIAFDRPDVVLPGDLALRKAIRQVYGLDELPAPAEVLRIAEPWRPYRSLASAYLFHYALGG